MKQNGHGQAKLLTNEEFTEILETAELKFGLKYKVIFGIAYYTGCRMSECLQLRWSDICSTHITFRNQTTKTKKTRQVPISSKLKVLLDSFKVSGDRCDDYLFPGRTKHLTIKVVDKNLKWICDYCDFKGISTHSFRRSAMTNMYRNGVPLTAIQEFTGHKDFNELRKYLEHDENAVVNAVELL